MATQKVQWTAINSSIERQSLQDMLVGCLNRTFALAGLTAGTNASSVKTVNTITYCVNGLLYSVGATDNLASTGAVQAVSTFAKYLVTVKGGSFTVTQGNPAASAALALLPDMPYAVAGVPDCAAVGYLQIATDATHTFTPGTTAVNAAGITATYADLSNTLTSV